MSEEKIFLFQREAESNDNKNEINIIWEVENDSDSLIENVVATSQSFTHDFGSIDAFNSKSVSFSIKIPSIDDLRKDFGEDASLPDTLRLGNVNLKYTKNNENYEVFSNSLEIPY